MLCRPGNQPQVGQELEAMVVWLHADPMRVGKKYAIKHTTREARCVVKDLKYRLDINTLSRDQDATCLGLNESGRLSLRVTTPLFYDEYRRNPATGSFVLIDEATNATVGAGMILGR
jgi:bifunctional enzyme CysN/CysC